jgi:hypothetical protein
MPAMNQVVQYLCQVSDKPDILFCRYFFKESLNKNAESILFSSILVFLLLPAGRRVGRKGRAFLSYWELFLISRPAEYPGKKNARAR